MIENDHAQDALNRMKRASDRGTGCHLTAEMIAALSVTFFSEVWSDEDPRKTPTNGVQTDDR